MPKVYTTKPHAAFSKLFDPSISNVFKNSIPRVKEKLLNNAPTRRVTETFKEKYLSSFVKFPKKKKTQKSPNNATMRMIRSKGKRRKRKERVGGFGADIKRDQSAPG